MADFQVGDTLVIDGDEWEVTAVRPRPGGYETNYDLASTDEEGVVTWYGVRQSTIDSRRD